MPIFDHFKLIAPFYDRIFQIQGHSRLLNNLDLPVSGNLLDAGGGTGRVAEILKENFSQTIVADLSFDMLLQAINKDNLITVCSHTERLPFREESFERIVMVDTLHHVCDHQQTVSELWRVLKKGGKIIIEEPDIKYFSVKLVALAEKLLFMRSSFIPPARIAALFFYPNAVTRIEFEDYNSWVIIEKSPD